MKRILIIEDDEMLLHVIERILGREGYETHIARNGKEAIINLETNDYDLVITDLMLPFANGLELINKIRSSKQKHTPVIILSSMVHENTVTDGFEIGADDYIRKPFMPSELLFRIKRLINK